jgi:hypothetical protein
MSSLRSLVNQIRLEALAVRHMAVFERARARHGVLARHQDMTSVLMLLSDEGERTYPEREALTQVMLAEHRAGSGTLWALALVAAFYPMLSRLRRRLLAGYMPREELNQIVLTAFLEALNEVQPDTVKARTAVRLRQRTQRHVFRILRREWIEQKLAAAVRELGVQVIQLGLAFDTQMEPARQREVPLPALLAHLPEGVLSKHGHEVLVATVIHQERLWDYVNRTVPGDAQTRERAYERLKRQRSRDINKLRAMFTGSAHAHTSSC